MGGNRHWLGHLFYNLNSYDVINRDIDTFFSLQIVNDTTIGCMGTYYTYDRVNSTSAISYFGVSFAPGYIAKGLAHFKANDSMAYFYWDAHGTSYFYIEDDSLHTIR